MRYLNQYGLGHKYRIERCGRGVGVGVAGRVSIESVCQDWACWAAGPIGDECAVRVRWKLEASCRGGETIDREPRADDERRKRRGAASERERSGDLSLDFCPWCLPACIALLGWLMNWATAGPPVREKQG